jgi:hypothetical protein
LILAAGVTGSVIEANVTDNDSGVFQVSYTATQSGYYTFDIDLVLDDGTHHQLCEVQESDLSC